MSIEDELRQSYQDLLDSHTRLQAEVAKNSSALRSFSTLPVGTILPFFGDLGALDGTDWVACTAENHQLDPKVPNLESRFLMGVAAGAMGTTGGRDRLSPDGAHDHGGVTGGLAYAQGEINWNRGPGHQDQFSHRHGIPGVGPHDHGGELRPPFFGACFIIRVKRD